MVTGGGDDGGETLVQEREGVLLLLLMVLELSLPYMSYNLKLTNVQASHVTYSYRNQVA